MRAIVETRKRASLDLPDIDVLISKGENDISVRISDQGGGIPRYKLQGDTVHCLKPPVDLKTKKFHFGLARPGQARPKRNFCTEVNGRF